MAIRVSVLSRCAAVLVLLTAPLFSSAHALRDPLERIPIAADRAAPVETVSGTVHRVTVDDRVSDVVIPVYSLAADDGRKLRLRDMSDAVPNGARVEATGRRNGKALFVQRVRLLSTPRAALAKSKTRSVNGQLALLHVDYFEDERSEFMFEVHDANGEAVGLDLDVAPEVLQAGMQVVASGAASANGTSIVPDTITIEASAPSAPAKALAKAAQTNNVLVILMTFTDSGPIPFTQSQVQAMFGGGPGSGSVSEYFKEASFGQQLINPAVTGWLATSSATPANCNWSQMGMLGRTAATAAGYNLAAYQNLVYVFPNVSACGWIGLAYVGASGVWINGRNATSAYGHELGHNFGLLHAASLRCGGGASIGGTCSVSEYGDPFDIMGNQSAMHFSASQKLDLGWIGPGTVATHTTGSATYVLNPVETGGGSLYAVKVSAFSNRTYWLEYRQPIGFDGALANYPNNGVQVRVASPFETLCPGCDAWSDDTELVDMTPGTSTFTDAALTVGRTFTDPTYGISFNVVSASASAVTVRVTAPGAVAASTTAIASSANPANAGAAVTFTATVGGSNPSGSVTFTSDGTTLAGCGAVALAGSGNTKTASCGTSALAGGTHTILAAYGGDAANAGSSASVAQTINGAVNVALAVNGGVASASSAYGPGYPPSAAIDNARTGSPWGNGGGWNDATPGAFPDWLQINFAGSKTIERVVVYSLQDNYLNPVEPTPATTFSLRGIVDFDIQGWNGAAWTTLASVTGNNLVKRSVTFAPTTTDRIRIVVNRALATWTRITEVEAWTSGGPRQVGSATTLASGANPSTAGAAATFSATVSGASPTGSVNFLDGGNAIPGCNAVPLVPAGSAATATCTTTNLAAGTHAIVASYGGDAGNNGSVSAPLSQTVNPSGPIDVALAANGAVAWASSTYGSGYSPNTLIDNARSGANWGNGGGWNDATPNAFPDRVEIDFAGTKLIDRVVVYSVQDNYLNPVEPTDSMTFTLRGVVDFTVEGWTGSSWVTLGFVSGNNLVKRAVTFSTFATTAVRVNVTRALGTWTRITEVEAWGN